MIPSVHAREPSNAGNTHTETGRRSDPANPREQENGGRPS
jgi:hypothetical protein